MKYYVYSYRQYSECDLNIFDTKEEALEYVSKQDPEEGDGWCQIICAQGAYSPSWPMRMQNELL